MEIIRRDFASLADFVDAGASMNTDMPERIRKSRETRNPAWFGNTKCFSEAAELAFNWREGAERITKLRAKITTHTERFRDEVVLREVGPGTLSMGNYLAGHPQPYVVLQKTPTAKQGRGKVVNVLVHRGTSSKIEASVIERRGAAVLSLLDLLERAGRRVNLTVLFANVEDDDYRYEQYVTIKQATQKLNLVSVAFAIAHPAMHRRISFGVRECESVVIRKRTGVQVGSGQGAYGRSVNVVPPAGAIYIGRMYADEPQWATEAAAARWVTETAKAQGIEIKD